MEKVCPLCNGLQNYEIQCEKCCEKMIDKGRIADYYDNYSSYLDMNITELIDGVKGDKCVHIFSCPLCNSFKRITVAKVIN